MRIGGQVPIADHVKNAFWSFTVQNVFNDMYYDYGIASTSTIGRFNAYPQPGRTFMFRAGFESSRGPCTQRPLVDGCDARPPYRGRPSL